MDPRVPSTDDEYLLEISEDGIAYIMLAEGTILKFTSIEGAPGYRSTEVREPTPLPPLRGKFPPAYKPPSLGGGAR